MTLAMYVNYEIEGYKTAFQAGPYGPEDVDSHHRDIQSYAGVKHCYIVEQRDERRRLMR